MISGENIQRYINFLHQKRYNVPAEDELLNRWKSLNDFEIIQQLQGLYNYWGIDSMTATMYERLFIQSYPLPEASAQPPTAIIPDNSKETGTKKASTLSYLITVLIAVIIIIVVVFWIWKKNGTPSETNTELQKRMQQVQDSISQERAIREQQEQTKEREAFEKAQKLKLIKANINKFITQKVTYDYNGFFGGIDNVQVTVSNNSDFKLNEVTVQLSYIKKNGELYDTKYITVPNVPAHGQKTVSGPESKRGTSIGSKITKVFSDELEGE